MTPDPASLLGNFPFECIAWDKFMYQKKKKKAKPCFMTTSISPLKFLKIFLLLPPPRPAPPPASPSFFPFPLLHSSSSSFFNLSPSCFFSFSLQIGHFIHKYSLNQGEVGLALSQHQVSPIANFPLSSKEGLRKRK